MSNKQDQIWLGIAETDADLNRLTQIGTIAVHGTCTNMPPDIASDNWGLLTVSSNAGDGGTACTQRLSIMVVEGWEPLLYERNWNGFNWSKWARIATTTSPEEYDLPLETSVFANYDSSIWLKSSYRKSQTGIVTVTIMGRFATDLQSDNDKLLASLPTGYRPKGYMRRIESTFYEAMVQIDISNSGSIYVRGSAKANDWLCCELSFVSAN